MHWRWDGRPVAVVASGPSLTREDCQAVHAAGLPIIAVNTAWTFAPFCDVIYAADGRWWREYGPEITSSAHRVCCHDHVARAYGAHYHRPRRGQYNSGLRAIDFAADTGATGILLLGFDCSLAHGTHCHGDHPRSTNPTQKRVTLWHALFAQQAERLAVPVLNCSRHTELRAFPLSTLEGALNQWKKQ